MEKITIIALHLAFGGVEKAVTNMANLFADRYDVEILCTYQLPDAPAYPLDKRIHVRYLMKHGPNKKEFKESLRNHQPFRVLIEGSRSIRILYQKKNLLKRAIKGIHEGIVITTRNEDTILVSKYLDPQVYTIAQLHHDHNFEKKYVHSFQKLYTNIDVLALLNQQMCEEVKEIMKDNHHTRCTVIPNFIDIPSQEVEFENKKNHLIAIGRLHPVKGFDRMIVMAAELLRNHPTWDLQIIGDGEEYDHLVELIRKEQMQERITLLGRKNSDEILQLLHEASLYLMTSHSEGFGIVLIEAMACGVPCIAMDVRVGPKSIIQNGKDGYICADGDKEAFCRAISSLMEDSQKRCEMGKAALQNAECYSRETVGDIWFKELKKGEHKHDK